MNALIEKKRESSEVETNFKILRMVTEILSRDLLIEDFQRQ